MCGISGYISTRGNIDKKVLNRMRISLNHRGPDDNGMWVNNDKKVGMSHSRLSIIDLSKAGVQPMTSQCSRYTMIFNGEIYNFKNIKEKIKKSGKVINWRGHSDTEVLLESLSTFGIEETLKISRGMFSIALWDNYKGYLYLIRDRIGEKPLYYGQNDSAFFFASELKALKCINHWNFEINSESLALQLRYGYVPSPYCIYKNVFKLEPGYLLKISKTGKIIHKKQWWALQNIALNSTKIHNCFKKNIKSLDNLLCEVLSEQIYSDVPMGALLSGGVDSSLIVSVMSKVNQQKTNTFSIGFKDKKFDESFFSKKIAEHLKTNHTELILEPSDVLQLIPKLCSVYDEPFGDSSQVPTTIICKVARKKVKVALTGDGGDELFSGYNRYFWIEKIWNNLKRIPLPYRKALKENAKKISSLKYEKLFLILNYILIHKFSNSAEKFSKFLEILDCASKEEIYIKLISQFKDKLPITELVNEPNILQNNPNTWPQMKNFSDTIMYVDTLTYLPDDILAKVDRASMSVSLETRIPFLDARVIDFAWNLPSNQKLSGTKGKKILKSLLNEYVPKKLTHRPKQGFSLPISKWLRGPLKSWADELLNYDNLSADPYLDQNEISLIWKKHLHGFNMEHSLWNILMYQMWKKKWF